MKRAYSAVACAIASLLICACREDKPRVLAYGVAVNVRCLETATVLDPSLIKIIASRLTEATSMAVTDVVPKEDLRLINGDNYSLDRWGMPYRMKKVPIGEAQKRFGNPWPPTGLTIELYSSGANRRDELGRGDDACFEHGLVELIEKKGSTP